MAASRIELALQRFYTVLQAAFPAHLVDRGRDGGIAPEECPAINLRRAEVQTSAHGLNSIIHTGVVEIDFFRTGADHETTADADHVAAHAALLADSALNAIITSLLGTETESATGDAQAGRLTARYEFVISTPRNSLTV